MENSLALSLLSFHHRIGSLPTGCCTTTGNPLGIGPRKSSITWQIVPWCRCMEMFTRPLTNRVRPWEVACSTEQNSRIYYWPMDRAIADCLWILGIIMISERLIMALTIGFRVACCITVGPGVGRNNLVTTTTTTGNIDNNNNMNDWSDLKINDSLLLLPIVELVIYLSSDDKETIPYSFLKHR